MSEADRFEYEIAVVGLAGRFPGARDVDEFWRRLREGAELITFFTDEELLRAGVGRAALDDPRYVRAEGVLEGAELFDAAFFGFTPREAETLDPQHRLFLEESWAALERAGYDPETYRGRVGVFAGESLNSYFLHNLYPNRALLASLGGAQTAISNDRDYLATQVSYRLNLKGPSLTVQTSCSTSLVAVHLACQSLLNRECDMALAGGVSVSVPQGRGAQYQEGGVISPDGHCRAFDAAARGTVRGSGVGVVVLKRLADALADGDHVRGVIKSSAVNNDGAAKVGFTAPGVEGQAGVIEEALALASVEPETVTYVEAHGTATALGDPVEIAALTQAFRTGTDRKNYCAVGSVKTNIGHLDAAAGVAGLVKTVLALEHGEIPPSLHFERPNPNINFADSPFFVNTKLRPWETAGAPRRAGVSSFGIGGTNAHVVLEEAPAGDASDPPGSHHLLVLSARTPEALERATANLAARLRRQPLLNPADVAYTLGAGRRAFEHRRAVVCRDLSDAASVLETPDAPRVRSGRARHAGRPVAFMFTGQGAQRPGMGRELYEREPAFREELDRCAELLEPHLDADLRGVIYGDELPPAEAAARLAETRFAQPALFAVEYALAKLWAAWGVKPSAMIGHSVGEYVAACVAGVFSLEDALRLVAARGRLMQRLPRGAMLAVSLSPREVEGLLGDGLSLAAVNAPALSVLSGAVEAVERAERRLAGEGVVCRRLHTSHAFHSALMEPALEEFAELVRGVERRAPRLPYVSNLTGTWVTEAEAVAPSYWARHLRETVRFSEGLAELLKEPATVLLEVGPGQTLTALAGQQPGDEAGRVALASLGAPGEGRSEVESILQTVGGLWLAGVEIDWRAFYAGGRRRRVELPTYPFERRRHWIDPPEEAADPAAARAAAPVEKSGPDHWLYVPSWKRAVAPERAADEALAARGSCCVIFVNDGGGLGARVVQKLSGRGATAVSVVAGEAFRRVGRLAYEINPRRREDYEALLEELRSLGLAPAHVMHLWGVTAAADSPLAPEAIDAARARGFDSLILLSQALGDRYASAALTLCVVTTGAQALTGEEVIEPGKALALGPCRVIPLEYRNVRCRSVDVTPHAAGGAGGEALADQLIAELAAPSPEQVVAYRGRHRWVQIFEPLPPPPAASGAHARTPRLREGGVYLLTGGLSPIDVALAEHLSRAARARLVLTGDADFPARAEWGRWLETRGADDDLGRRLRALLALEEGGAGLLVRRADVGDEAQLRAVVTEARARFGEINGVIHTAAVYGGGLIQLKTLEESERVLAPKVRGALALSAILREPAPDFFVLFSSALAHTGVQGQADFCAAGAFLDAFAQHEATRPETFTAAIDWRLPHWEAWGGPAPSGAAGAQTEFAEARDAYGVTPAEGVEAFARILAGSQPQVVVSTQDFQALVERQRAAAFEGAEGGTAEAVGRVEAGAEFSSGAEIETAVAGLWRELFGVEDVRPGDNFFDLGGNSLLALQLVARLRQTFQVELPLRVVFETQTAAALSARIHETRVREQEAAEIERLLREIEGLAPEELRASLEQETGAARGKQGDG
ncbi:MAG TPA: beta-ketoacyl synthase N-terminal-like domain-containing protein [Pyrinomonadaceae bacterium]